MWKKERVGKERGRGRKPRKVWKGNVDRGGGEGEAGGEGEGRRLFIGHVSCIIR